MSKKRSTLGIGIIGGGFIARFHIRSWVGVRDADIRGVFDPDAKRAREACALVKSLGVGEAQPFASIAAMPAGIEQSLSKIAEALLRHLLTQGDP